MRKTFVRGKENYSLAEKKELGELVEKYKKEDDKEVKQKSTLLTLFRHPRIFQPPCLLYFTQISYPLLIGTPRLFGNVVAKCVGDTL